MINCGWVPPPTFLLSQSPVKCHDGAFSVLAFVLLRYPARHSPGELKEGDIELIKFHLRSKMPLILKRCVCRVRNEEVELLDLQKHYLNCLSSEFTDFLTWLCVLEKT